MPRTREEIRDELRIIQAQAGDQTALHDMVEVWHPRLLRHACFLTKREDASSEIVQDAWVAIIRGLRNLQDPAAFKPWAFRIVQNLAVDWIRRESRKRVAIAEAARSVVSCDESPANSNNAIDKLRGAIGKLSPELQSAIRLFYSESMSVKQISQVVGLAEGTVKNRLFRARQQLKSMLESKES